MADRGVIKSVVAESVPFDNDNNGFASDDVQTAIEEVNSTLQAAAVPGFAYGRSGNSAANSWLLNNQVPSNVVGVPVGINNAVITEIWVGSQDIDTYDIEIYEHDGNETNLTLVTTVNVVSARTATFSVSIPITTGKQLGVKLTNGSAKNIKAFVLVKGTI